MILSLLVVNETPEDQQALGYIQALAATGSRTPADQLPPPSFEARFRAKDGRPVDVLLTATPISMAGKDGVILIARSLIGQKAMEAAFDETRRQFLTMSDALSLGVFRSTWGRKATLVEANPAMRGILQLPPAADLASADWLERSSTPTSAAPWSTASTKTRWSRTTG